MNANTPPDHLSPDDPWMEGDFRDEIQCPHCNALDEERTDYPRGMEHDGDTATHTCWNCQKKMTVTLSVAYSFATDPAR